MVVLATSICTKTGKGVISRQFRSMTRTRIESLLASFPKLIPTNTQHTSVETAEVRYVYQPLEDLYIVLITNKASNILQDIDTLHLFARVVSDLCRSAEEKEILKHAFELLGAFDEIISMGHRENISLTQVRSILEMESHEEKIQELIAKNKEAEAKEELKRRAKQLEMQRREQQKRASAGFDSGARFLSSSIAASYSSIPRYETPDFSTSTSRNTLTSSSASSKAPAFKGSGMKLGSKKTKQAELLDALGGDVLATTELAETPASVATVARVPVKDVQKASTGRGSLPIVEEKGVHIIIKESVSLSLLRDGGLQNMEVKGDINLQVFDPAHAQLKITLAPSDFSAALQFKHHPNVAKFVPDQPRVVSLKDPSRAFPVGQSLAVLRWRYTGNDESNVPLSINCWPSPSNDGTCEVSIEYELENESLTLYDVIISIPLPDGSYPTVSTQAGEWSIDSSTHSLIWTIPIIRASDESKSGSLMFTVGGADAEVFFPVKVGFVGQGSLAGVSIGSVEKLDGSETPDVSIDSYITTDEYLVE